MTLATLHVHNYDTHQRIHDVRIYFMMSGTTVVLMSTEFAKSCKVMQTLLLNIQRFPKIIGSEAKFHGQSLLAEGLNNIMIIIMTHDFK